MATLLDIATKGTAISLGRLSLSAGVSAVSGGSSIRSTTSYTTGKYYFEVTCSAALAGNQAWFIGACIASQDMNNIVGVSTAGTSYRADGTIWYNNGNPYGTWQGCINGDIVGVAVDLGANLMWARNGRTATWNAGGSADPATGVGGIAIPGSGAARFIGWSGKNNGSFSSVVLNTGATPFLIGAPSGFSAWDASAVTPGGLHLSPSTWNPADKDAAVALSGGNLVATQSGSAGNYRSVRSLSYRDGGKAYFEHTITAFSNNVTGAVSTKTQLYGFLHSNAALTNFVGADQYGIGAFDNGGGSGQIYSAASAVNSQWEANTVNGDVLCWAVDIDRGLFWIRRNGGLWNNSSTANPYLGIGGIGITLWGDIYLGWTGKSTTSNDVETLNTGATAFARPMPTGYVSWDNSVLASGAVAWSSTFNPSNYVLTNVNASGDRARHATGAGAQNIISATALPVGKVYFEYIADQMGANNTGGGICDSTVGPTTAPSNLTNCVFNTAAFGYVPGGTGQHIEMAVDVPNKRAWFRSNGGAWVGSGGTPDPNTPSTGLDFSALAAGPLYVLFSSLSAGSENLTLLTGGNIVHAPPSGYTVFAPPTAAPTGLRQSLVSVVVH